MIFNNTLLVNLINYFFDFKYSLTFSLFCDLALYYVLNFVLDTFHKKFVCKFIGADVWLSAYQLTSK